MIVKTATARTVRPGGNTRKFGTRLISCTLLIVKNKKKLNVMQFFFFFFFISLQNPDGISRHFKTRFTERGSESFSPSISYLLDFTPTTGAHLRSEECPSFFGMTLACCKIKWHNIIGGPRIIQK